MHEKRRNIFEYALEFARLSFQCITIHFAHYSSVLAKVQLQQHAFIFMLEIQTKILFSSTSQKLRNGFGSVTELILTLYNAMSTQYH